LKGFRYKAFPVSPPDLQNSETEGLLRKGGKHKWKKKNGSKEMEKKVEMEKVPYHFKGREVKR